MKSILPLLLVALACESSTAPGPSITFDQQQYVVTTPATPSAISVPVKIVVRGGGTTLPATVTIDLTPAGPGCGSPGVFFTSGSEIQVAVTSPDSVVATPSLMVCPIPGATSNAYLKGSTEIFAVLVGSTTASGTAKATVVVQ